MVVAFLEQLTLNLAQSRWDWAVASFFFPDA